MKLSNLTAISPVDGRYEKITIPLRNIFSEYALLKFRIKIEIHWIKKLSDILLIPEIPKFSQKTIIFLDNIVNNFNENDAKYIKLLEKNINHDVKSIEYFLKEKFSQILELKEISQYIHFACTSEDINNLSYALMLKTARKEIIVPIWNSIIKNINNMALKYKEIPMLSRTHGQPATPSTVGKEFLNFSYRMQRQLNQFNYIEILGKFNGATGNYNAHLAAYPNINWHKISQEFVLSLDIGWNPYTTQIEPHDYIAEFFNCMLLFNNILLDFNQDMWGYISKDYFTQKIIFNEIGSSTMPHKVNPIYFENSEGNLGLANALIKHITSKLLISRWQRDLSDSTVLRNLGIIISYSIIAYDSVLSGIKRIEVNDKKILYDLNIHWEVLSEAIQTVMKKYNINNAYEQLKKFTCGKKINSTNLHVFINNLPIPIQEKKRLIKFTPSNYIGDAVQLVISNNKDMLNKN
ncbi:adenylosuccinate lyase [Buchnera aphidicola (Formosaphis micheliae)]|uniref:adenylosuccinate lyase n=1 Tax=Buchnera aphidicola TaxID=9 RepID=UPI0031B84EFB